MSYFKAGRLDDERFHGYVLKPLHLRSDKPENPIKKTILIRTFGNKEQITIKFYGTERDKKAN